MVSVYASVSTNHYNIAAYLGKYGGWSENGKSLKGFRIAHSSTIVTRKPTLAATILIPVPTTQLLKCLIETKYKKCDVGE